MKKWIVRVIIFLALFGLADASFITWEHFSGSLPPCSVNWWVDCGKVLKSSYASWWGVPVAVTGILHYLAILFLATGTFLSSKWQKQLSWLLLFQTGIGFIFSLYFVFLQFFVIQAICLYCMFSAVISTVLFTLVVQHVKGKRELFLLVVAKKYQVLKYVFFKFDAELVHTNMVLFGEWLGKLPLLKTLLGKVFNARYPLLSQTLESITFKTPVGLAAGFDYEARLTQILPHLGFGFQTVGTITNKPCKGNDKPRLGRLPKSRALLVNKGFRNPGAKAIIQKLSPLSFGNVVGISIGQTNTSKLSSYTEVIEDVVHSFNQFEKSSTWHQYYELNISCPNLQTKLTFYDPKKLDLLLSKIDALHLSRPVFVKMPINESDETTLSLLRVIAKHSPVGIIIGNLQKNRQHSSVVSSERQLLLPGNLSGKPTFERSNHLIALTYKHFRRRFIIVGCGGVFTPQDAYLKISLGASLIQMITGLIFQGPQVVAQINQGLSELLTNDGYTSIKQAVGSKNAEYWKK